MKSARNRQLSFAFADSPMGGGDERKSDVSDGTAWLLHRAKNRKVEDLATSGEADESLMERIAFIGNLALALRNVARNKGAPGVDKRSVEEVIAVSPRLLFTLRRALLDGGYRPGDIRRVWIPKPGGGQRGLGIPNVVDRWVQEAVRLVLEPIFEPRFHPSSLGFRPGRGAATAIAEAKAHVATGYEWVVDMGLSKFCDRVHHQRLLARLGQHVADPRVLTLVNWMLKAAVVMPDGVRIPTVEGTPQGGPLSPLLSNIVLDELDWELDRRGLRFVRYADDCNIFVGSERAGCRVMDSTRRFVERKLRLRVNEKKSAVARPEERHFLGFRLRPSGDGRVAVHISKRTKDRLDAKIRELTPRSWGQSLTSLFESVNSYLRGWFGYYRLCTEEEASAPPLSTPCPAWHHPEDGRCDGVSPQRHLEEEQSARADPGLSQSLVSRAADVALRNLAELPYVSGGLAARPALCREITIRRAGCVAHKSGSVRGAAG